MSVQFGRWNFDGKPIEQDYLDRLTPLIAPYGPDDVGLHTECGTAILHHAFHTTRESRREIQPHLSSPGAVITWDGRLDNRAALVAALNGSLTARSTDIEIVAAAYKQWGNECLVRFVGDWALVIWNKANRCLVLAKDFVGIRPLYYLAENEHITWSTILDPLVLLAGKTLALEEEYIAGWLSSFPAVHLTPYRGISSVPPASVVEVGPTGVRIKKYWDFDPGKRIRYCTDAEYEEHFRIAFRESVRRRLRSDSPILAELSGGIDSSSIVCMADSIIECGAAETPRLDTVSYYDDSEPNWNERPYFAKVEEKRGRTGCHIAAESGRAVEPPSNDHCLPMIPGCSHTTESGRQFIECLRTNGNRVLLSGIGGDEVLGGVPTPLPELADLLVSGQLGNLVRQMVAWALSIRKPVLHLTAETLRVFLPQSVDGLYGHRLPAPWLHASFVKRYRPAIRGYESRLKIFGSPPPFQANLVTLDALRRQMASFSLSERPLYEFSYPYLDRDLMEFVYAIPRQQLLRPHQRRSLMRRALAGIVPDELLNRKRKAFVVRGPLLALTEQSSSIGGMTEPMVTEALGIVDPKIFAETLASARRGLEVPVVALMRTLQIEIWLRRLATSGLFEISFNTIRTEARGRAGRSRVPKELVT